MKGQNPEASSRIQVRDWNRIVEGEGRSPRARLLTAVVAGLLLTLVLCLWTMGRRRPLRAKNHVMYGVGVSHAKGGAGHTDMFSQFEARPRPLKGNIAPVVYMEPEVTPLCAPRRALVEPTRAVHGLGDETLGYFAVTDSAIQATCAYDFLCEDANPSEPEAPGLRGTHLAAAVARGRPVTRLPPPPGRTTIRPVVSAKEVTRQSRTAREQAWAVQVRAYRDAELAREYVAWLRGKGLEARIEEHVDEGGKKWYRVRVGRFSELSQARRFAAEVARAIGDEAIVVALKAPQEEGP